jgi:hypothetical protein
LPAAFHEIGSSSFLHADAEATMRRSPFALFSHAWITVVVEAPEVIAPAAYAMPEAPAIVAPASRTTRRLSLPSLFLIRIPSPEAEARAV